MFWRRRPKTVPDFESWWMDYGIQNPHESLDSMMDRSIQQFDILVRHEIDEPRKVSLVRTKLDILEKSLLSIPDLASDPAIQNYAMGLRASTQMWDAMSPETREAYRKKYT